MVPESVVQGIGSLGYELAYLVITAYAALLATRLVTRALFFRHEPLDLKLLVEGLGGLLYLIGFGLWLNFERNPQEGALLIKSVGFTMMLFSRLLTLGIWGGNGGNT